MTEPADAAVGVGTAVSFTVTATGDATLTYQWLRDGAPINGATGTTYTLASPLLTDDGARFSVVVSDGSASVTSRTATLSVSGTPGIALLAGGLGGPGNLDGIGSAARLDAPAGLVVGPGGDIFISDTNMIRKLTAAGEVTAFAGRYRAGGYMDGTLANALFRQPAGLAFDAAGNLFVADYPSHNIRKITPAGTVSTFAGSTTGSTGTADGTGTAARFNQPWGLAIDSSGNLFVADANNNTIRMITATGVVSTFAGTAGAAGSADGVGSAARFRRPFGLVIDNADNLYVADTGNNTIRKITPSGTVSTLAGSVAGYRDGAGTAAAFSSPWGIALVGQTLYVADAMNNMIRAVTLAGMVSTVAGAIANGSDDGPAAAARFNRPLWVAGDSAGNLYVADAWNATVRKITPAGVVSTAAGLASHAGSRDGIGAAAQFWAPQGVAMDAAGNAYVADSANHTIRKIAPDGTTTTYAGSPGAIGTADGTGPAAQFNAPRGVAVDAAGNVYVADSDNQMIRKIAPGGVVSTLAGNGTAGAADGNGAAAQFNGPARLCVDGAGNVYVADTYNHTIRKITPAGDVTTLAGAPGSAGRVDDIGTAARFDTPCGIAITADGILFVADSQNYLIRRIAQDGTVSTFAGSGTFGNADGTGAACTFGTNSDLAMDAAGDLFVCDDQSLVRKIDAGATVTTLYGQPGQVGVRTGAAPGAFNYPCSIAVAAGGKLLYVTDNIDNAVLAITRS